MTSKFNKIFAVVEITHTQNFVKLSAAVHEISC